MALKKTKKKDVKFAKNVVHRSVDAKSFSEKKTTTVFMCSEQYKNNNGTGKQFLKDIS
jgi:hypothetical protein